MPRHKTAASTYQPLTVRFPREIFEEIRSYAEEEDRSINEQVLHFIKNHLKLKRESVREAPRPAEAQSA